MKLEVFKSIMESLVDLYDKSTKRDIEFQKIFGSDTYIITDWNNNHINSVITSLSKELNDTNEWVSWLFWYSLLYKETAVFNINDKEYKGTIENIYHMLVNPDKMELL